MAKPPQTTYVDDMRNRVIWLLVQDFLIDKERNVYYKDAVWEETRKIEEVFEEYGSGLKDKVFKKLVDRQDIEDLGTKVRITEQGVKRSENQPPPDLFLHGQRYLQPAYD
jgi:hypothetical protein